MSLIKASRCLPELWMSPRYSACLAFTSPNISSLSTSEKPMMALSGVRSSCDMLARNSDLCWLATSSCTLFSCSWLKRRTLRMAITAWSAKACSNCFCLSGIRPCSLERIVITPMQWPSCNRGATQSLPAVSSASRSEHARTAAAMASSASIEISLSPPMGVSPAEAGP